MSGKIDEFDAARKVAELLEPLESQKRQLVIKWALEKLGDSGTAPVHFNQSRPGEDVREDVGTGTQHSDIKSFIESKNPKSKIHTVAAIAYYYAFEAKPQERKEYINKNDVTNALRLAGKPRDTNPLGTLNNAVRQGVLDRGESGSFKINTVGENLIALVLPDNGSSNNSPRKKHKKKKKASKKKKTK